MIALSIEPHKALFVPSRRHNNGKPKLVVGSDAHKKAIFDGIMEHIYNTDKYELGSTVYRAGKEGVIINLIPFNEVTWDGLKALPIEVWWHGLDEFDVHHPGDLKTK